MYVWNKFNMTSTTVPNGSPPGHPNTWTVEDVRDYLELSGFKSQAQLFKEHQISGTALCRITESHLEQIGIRKVGERIELLSVIEHLQNNNSPAPKLLKHHCKVFNDSIHGHTEYHPLCIRIIDTPQFQRLRDLLQLGGCYYVFPGASHKRFEHSLGVCHLAGKLARTISERQPELNITETDILCVELAGLCHDLGHGPFSHMFDGSFIPLARPGLKWRHEIASVEMFDHLLEVNNLMPVFQHYGLTERDCVFIKEQISGSFWDGEGEWPFKGREAEKSFLYEIVSNKRNGIDVDKWDYFSRDCANSGLSNNFDHMRFMTFVRVLKVQGQMQICCRDKEVGTVYEMFRTRHMLHRRVYEHSVKNIIEFMLCEALLVADKHIKVAGKNGKLFSISESIDDMEAYEKVSDGIFHQIRLSTDPNLKPAQDILTKISRRDLYKCIGRAKPVDNCSLTKSDRSKICDEIVQKSESKDCGPLNTDDIIVQVIKLDYGMNTQNPIDYVRFYRKNDPTRAYKVKKDEVSDMLPQCFQENYIQAYCRSTDKETQRLAEECFQEWFQSSNMSSSSKDRDLLDIVRTASVV